VSGGAQARFDVVRVRECEVAVEPTAPCAEYSWFPGQAWRMAACPSCHTHLGWHFQPAPCDDEGNREGSEGEATLCDCEGEGMQVERPLGSWGYPHRWGTRLGVWARPPAQSPASRGEPGVDFRSP
jgi:hypothetical protein